MLLARWDDAARRNHTLPGNEIIFSTCRVQFGNGVL
jgi:hypothetical protein